MKGDVSNEIDILKMINNSNVNRLSGFCVHEVNTHLVYQFTENGSLADWLLSNNKYRSLAWKQIIQIAYDVADALNYLLNYTNPPYIQKNLKTSNIFLDANLRAKLADFGLAITLENDQDGGFQSTRHDSGYSKLYGPLNTSKMESAQILDVLASGVVMLELLSGKEAAAAAIEKSSGDELLSVTIVRVLEVDNARERLSGFLYPLDLAFPMAQQAKSCVYHDLNTRASITQVFRILSKFLSSSFDWDPSDELDRSTSLG